MCFVSDKCAVCTHYSRKLRSLSRIWPQLLFAPVNSQRVLWLWCMRVHHRMWSILDPVLQLHVECDRAHLIENRVRSFLKVHSDTVRPSVSFLLSAQNGFTDVPSSWCDGWQEILCSQMNAAPCCSVGTVRVFHILLLSGGRKDAVCSDARSAIEISNTFQLANMIILIFTTFVIFSNKDCSVCVYSMIYYKQ